MSPVSFPHWSPVEPDNSYLIAALEDAGIDPDWVVAQPDGTWEVEGPDDFVIISISDDPTGKVSPQWEATFQSGGQVIASGELATVASAVAEVVRQS